MKSLNGKKIILGVSGGIAAYKACDLVRRLRDKQADVHVVLTKAAQAFVAPLSLQALSQNPVHSNLFSLTEESEMGHIQLADEADLVLIAPTTADLLAKISCGLADDLLTTLILVTQAPVLLAPSMNVNMWEKEIVQNHAQQLRQRGYQVLEPDQGELACGWEGKGRLPDPQVLVDAVLKCLNQANNTASEKILYGKKVLINAGPTREYLDPIRFISNPSSGKMGYALAQEAQYRGAQVTLVSGPVSLTTPPGVERIDVVSAEEMHDACKKSFKNSDIFIATAAVGDYRVKEPSKHKIKKQKKEMEISLIPNVDILQSLAKSKNKKQKVIGFAAETKNLLPYAQEKLEKKNLDMIVANDVSKKNLGFASERNAVTLITKAGKKISLAEASKEELARDIWDNITKNLL